MLIVQDDVRPVVWARELEEVLLRLGHRFGRADLRRRMRAYVHGLLGPVGRKNGWQLAEYVGHSSPAGLQHLLNRARWDADEVRDDVHAYVAEGLGEDGGVVVIDETGFLKKGDTSAGVQRQYSGTTGRTENCQVAVFAAYASSRGRGMVDRELYLPRSWTSDRQRCPAAKVPDDRGFATKTELARILVTRALSSPLPIAWVTADALYGQDRHFRRMIEEAGLGMSSLCRNRSRSSRSQGAGASTSSLATPLRTPGRGSRAETARRARVSTTGPSPNCRPSRSSTVTSPPTAGG